MNPILDHSKDFSLLKGHTWLNAASEGPLPRVSAQALKDAVTWKSSPHLLTVPKFQQVPLTLKRSIARLINADDKDIILGNSATYGLHLLANGLSFKRGDEVLLMRNDFPSDILPWLSLKAKGVLVRQLASKGPVLTPDEIRAAVNTRARVLCLSQVHTFSGHAIDVKAIGQICRTHGICFVLNLSKAAGAFDVQTATHDADAIVCAGYKWLLGPYGTGFCWIKQEVREQLDYAQNYWISLMDEQSLAGEQDLVLNDTHSARRYDVFGTANFFNFVPWQASIDYLLTLGIKNVAAHNQALVEGIIEGIDQKKYRLVSPREKGSRTNIIVFTHQKQGQNNAVFEYLRSNKFYPALWKGKVRLAPHIYNTMREIDRLVKTLNAYDKE